MIIIDTAYVLYDGSIGRGLACTSSIYRQLCTALSSAHDTACTVRMAHAICAPRAAMPACMERCMHALAYE